MHIELHECCLPSTISRGTLLLERARPSIIDTERGQGQARAAVRTPAHTKA
jgi:hypothetical protein